MECMEHVSVCRNTYCQYFIVVDALLIPTSLLYTWMQHKRIITAQLLAEIHSGSVIRKCHKLLLHQFNLTIWLGIETFIFLLYNSITGDMWLCSFRSPQMLKVYLAALPLRGRVHIFSKSNLSCCSLCSAQSKEAWCGQLHLLRGIHKSPESTDMSHWSILKPQTVSVLLPDTAVVANMLFFQWIVLYFLLFLHPPLLRVSVQSTNRVSISASTETIRTTLIR